MSDPEKEQKSTFLPTSLLIQVLLAAIPGSAIVLAGNLTGWWAALSKAILPNIESQRLLDSVGILLCLLLLLSLVCLQQWFACRKLKKAASQPIQKREEPIQDPLKKRIDMQERLLIIAADSSVGSLTLKNQLGVHRVTSCHHFTELCQAGLLETKNGGLHGLSALGNAYLVKHGIVPEPKPSLKTQAVQQTAYIPKQ